jgi:hypothetical protein
VRLRTQGFPGARAPGRPVWETVRRIFPLPYPPKKYHNSRKTVHELSMDRTAILSDMNRPYAILYTSVSPPKRNKHIGGKVHGTMHRPGSLARKYSEPSG